MCPRSNFVEALTVINTENDFRFIGKIKYHFLIDVVFAVAVMVS